MGRQKYKTEEERLEAKRESKRKWYQGNKDKVLEQQKLYCKQWREKNPDYFKVRREKNPDYFNLYYQSNKDKVLEQQKQYRQTPMGRAINLVKNYKRNDKKYDRGECTLTAQWIMDNIFSQKCIYCGESDWSKLGCDRKDNSKPHTEDNVVCCCWDCNIKRQKKEFEEFLNEIR